MLQPRTWHNFSTYTDGFKPHQRGGGCCNIGISHLDLDTLGFKPHQRGGGCCNLHVSVSCSMLSGRFQTPSAGRWVLQLDRRYQAFTGQVVFQTPSAGRWVLQPTNVTTGSRSLLPVSNPISGEVGAATPGRSARPSATLPSFQTPSAGRWVLQQGRG